MKNDRLVPKLRFSEFNGTWNETKVESIINTIDSGWSPQCLSYPTKDLEWGVLKTTSVVWSGFNEEENKKLPLNLDPRPEIQVEKDDILITRAGPTSRVGVVAIVGSVTKNLMLSDKIIRLRLNENNSCNFVSKVLGNKKTQYQLVRKSSGLAESQTNISQKIIKDTKIILPPLPEQEKIASFLSSVDSKIEKLEEKKELLDQYKKGAMQGIFSGGKNTINNDELIVNSFRFKKDDGTEYPAWEEKKLGELTNLITKGTTPTSLGYSFIEEGIHFIKAENISKTGFINIIETPKISDECNLKLKRSQIQLNDILFSIAGTLGRTAIVRKKDLPCNTNQALAILRFESNCNTTYINYCLNLYDMEKEIKRILSVGAQPNLNLEQVGNFKIKYPCLKEQEKIADFLSSIDKKIEIVGKEIEKNKEFKKGLLQQLFV